MLHIRIDSEVTMISKIAETAVGPVVKYWLFQLSNYMSYFDGAETRFLYCARAGVRIKKLYDIFSEQRPGAIPQGEIFWVSRISIAKGIFERSPEKSNELIAREYYYDSLQELVSGVLRRQPQRSALIAEFEADLQERGSTYPRWMAHDGEAQRIVRGYLEECSSAFDTYLHGLLDGRKRAVLIDSGWQGSSQSLLKHAYPEIDWKGLYFGRTRTENHDPLIQDDVIGLVFEADHYHKSNPASAFVNHRHLIETLLEPNGPSIEEIYAQPFLEVSKKLADDNLNEVVDPDQDALFLEICRYLEERRGESVAEIVAGYQKAMPELARMLIAPTPHEALFLAGKDRTADFGKSLMVPVLRAPSLFAEEDAQTRLKHALWYEGQVALENAASKDNLYPSASDTDMVTAWDRDFDENANMEVSAGLPKVAIITRTKNRCILLRRAAESVASQTYRDFVWVVVNDGGDHAAVCAELECCGVDRRKIRLLSHAQSLGMEAASNAGIRASNSDFIVIHDDDDSWEPDFLRKTVLFLESKGGQKYGGVITHSTYISEEIRGADVIIHEKRPYMEWVRTVELAEMFCGNFFAPISFLFRRSLYSEIGGFNEALPVLGDWYFTLELLTKADIGVIPELLANYHHRDRGDVNAAYANSVIGAVSKHEEYAPIVRNAFIRNYGKNQAMAFGMLSGYLANRNRSDLNTALHNFTPPKAVSDRGNRDDSDLHWLLAQFFAKDDEQSDPRLLYLGWDYFEKEIREGRLDPLVPSDFDVNVYLGGNPDVAAASVGQPTNFAYIHYILHGRKEGRLRPNS